MGNPLPPSQNCMPILSSATTTGFGVHVPTSFEPCECLHAVLQGICGQVTPFVHRDLLRQTHPPDAENAPKPAPAARIRSARTPSTAPAVAPADALRWELPGFCATTSPSGLQKAPNSPWVHSDPSSHGMPPILHGRCHGTTPAGTLASSQMLKNSFFCTLTTVKHLRQARTGCSFQPCMSDTE